MKQVCSIAAIALLLASTSMGMGRMKKSCDCPEGNCVCADKTATLPCGCKVGECKCATETK